ncbi:hypothetical protein VKT23_019355 [Stygiomarasmius scandens]|uniref:Uncharacterized protein n=1 Tax=Marasmiellus scandens TaxID=2682957 RepID=A0ABR1IPP9_9AGAR
MLSSPSYQVPSTPQSNRSLCRQSYTPINSSPLATSSPTYPSPISEAQARRKSQYKSRTASLSLVESPVYARTSKSKGCGESLPLSLRAGYSAGVASHSETHTLLRDKFKYRCLERAEKARKRTVTNRRKSQASSDDIFMEDDMDEETDEQLMSDEFYRRVMTNSNRQDARRRLRTYYDECGSSFDPDLRDVVEWEQELDDSRSSSLKPDAPDNSDLTPEEFENAELEAYAQECEIQAALADFEDIPLDQLFANDDVSELGQCEMDIDM